MSAPEPALTRKSPLETLTQRPALALPIFLLLGLLPGFCAFQAPIFEYDDTYATVQNPLIEHGLGYFFTQLTLPFQKDGFKEIQKAAHWAPLSFLSTALDHAVFGHAASHPPKLDDFAPWGFRLMTGLYHGLLGWLVWRLGLRLTGKVATATFAALLFLFHPTVCETVCWIIERNNVLPALFGALAFFVYVKNDSEEPSFPRVLGVVALLTLSQLSKASGISWCPLIVLWDLLFMKNSSLPRRAVRYALLMLPALLTLYVTLQSHHRVLMEPLGAERFGALGPWIYFVTLFGRYVTLLCWPVDLSAFYHVSPTQPDWGAAAAGFALLAGLALGAWRLGVPGRRVFFYLAWIVLAVGPVINPKVVTSYPLQDRYLYPALPAFGLLLGESFELAAQQFGKKFWAIASVIVLALLAGSVDRSLVWRNPDVLFMDAVKNQPQSAFAYFYLADRWMILSLDEKDPAHKRELQEAAINAHARALACDDYDRLISPLYTRTKFAKVLVDLGRIAEARALFQQVANARTERSEESGLRQQAREWIEKIDQANAPRPVQP